LLPLPRVLDFIREALLHKGKVLIFSDKGVSRAPALAIAYLMDAFGHTYFEVSIMLHVFLLPSYICSVPFICARQTVYYIAQRWICTTAEQVEHRTPCTKRSVEWCNKRKIGLP
jgi:hypothetical protein